MTPFGLALHGGAGAIRREDTSPEAEQACRAALRQALDAGYAVLGRGGPALDAAIAAVTAMEDCPLFNAGRGAVLNADGICELDAAVMDGRSQAAGAVAGLQHIRNPVTLARAVMEKSPHVMLIGEGAERFARQAGFELVPNAYFQTERRRRELEDARELAKGDAVVGEKFGTVGCAALDRNGNLAAATSTGGLTNKRYGRVGDSPIVGAGTYANNATCALSATGHGEYFIRAVVGHDVSAQMEYNGVPLASAAAAALAKVRSLGGEGGLAAIDARGNVALPFNTAGMYRAFRLSTGKSVVELYGDGNVP
jgi:beta-aspartyl-peptidase (threonine type)